MLRLTFIALAWLLGEPAASPEPMPADPSAEYAEALAEVEQLNIAVNRDPEANHAALAEAVEILSEYPDELARDQAARELRTLAQLNIARARLLAGDEDGAGAIIDEAIRAAGDAEIPANNFGPKLGNFFAKRLEALKEWGTGAIAVECSVPCRVLIDERVVEGGSAGLYFGSYRVWIAAEDPDAIEDPTPAEHTVEIDIDGEIEKLEYAPAPKIVEQPEPIVEPPKVEPPPKRLLPRWAEITGLVAGAALIITGGALLSADGDCVGGSKLDPMMNAQQCPQLWESTPGGAAALALGAALAVTGGVMLAVDEVRVGGQKGTQAVLTWTLRF